MTASLTTASFDAAIADQPTLVDFWAPWCGPCRIVDPILERLGDAHAGTLTVAKVNVDDEPAIAQRFRVMSVPTVALFVRGELVAMLTGARPAADYAALIRDHVT